jgi:hypothetical protein
VPGFSITEKRDAFEEGKKERVISETPPPPTIPGPVQREEPPI